LEVRLPVDAGAGGARVPERISTQAPSRAIVGALTSSLPQLCGFAWVGEAAAPELADLTLSAVATSIILHGVSAQPSNALVRTASTVKAS
jgi:hypothetical protein